MLQFAGDWTAEVGIRHIVDQLADVVDTAQIPAQAVPILEVLLASLYAHLLQ